MRKTRFLIIFVLGSSCILSQAFAEVKKNQDAFSETVSLFARAVALEKKNSLLVEEAKALRKENTELKASLKKLKDFHPWPGQEQSQKARVQMIDPSISLSVNPECSRRIESGDTLLARKTAHYNLGFLYAKNEDQDKAIKEYRKVLAISPKDRNAHFNLGYLYSLKKDFPEAIREYEAVLAIVPDDAEVCYNLALIYHQDLKDEAKARQYYEKFLKLSEK